MDKLNYNIDKFPRVTEALQGAGLVDLSAIRADVLEAASNFGTACHKACELWDKEDLVIEILSAPLIPYLDSWRKFKKDYDVVFEEDDIEKRVYSSRWQFRGTLDRIGTVKHKETLIDIKSSTTVMPSVAIQTAAYQIAYEEMAKIKVKQRWCVQLKPDGYKIEEFKNPSDKSVFLAALTIYNFRKEKGLWKTK